MLSSESEKLFSYWTAGIMCVWQALMWAAEESIIYSCLHITQESNVWHVIMAEVYLQLRVVWENEPHIYLRLLFIHWILSEQPLIEGRVEDSHTISCMLQKLWMFTGSVCQTILFGQPFAQEHYTHVVHVCVLKRDFVLLPLHWQDNYQRMRCLPQ
jgi:hypothetical protein